MTMPSGNIPGAHVVGGRDLYTNPTANSTTSASSAAATWDFVPFGISWVFIGFVLLILASFPASEKFAAMFSYLILASAVLVEGPNAIKNLQAGSPFGGTAVQSGSITTNVGTIPLGR